LSTILAPIDDAVAWIITHLFNAFSPIFGLTSGVTWLLTIVVLVVLMRLILVPLFIKQMHTQRAMTALAPRINELRKRHKGDKERLNQETMKLYQEAGVNPLMGCLPVVLQMPIFFALFSVLRFIAEWTKKTPLQYGLSRSLIVSAQHAKIFGATIADKVLFTGTTLVPLHAKIVILITVLVSMTTTYLTVRQSMKRGMMPTGDNSPMGQSQKMMAYVMPLFALTGLYWQFGLVLYWVTTNLWTLGQQFVLLRRYPIGAAVLATGTGTSTGPGAGSAKAGTAAGLTAGPPKLGRRGTAKGPAAGKPAESGQSGGASPNGKLAAGQEAEAGKAGKAAPQSSGRGSPGKPNLTKPAGTAAASGAPNGHKPSGADGGVLRRLGRGRAEPEPAVPPEPEAKIVRHQPQRQPRSKRTGRR